MATKFLDNTGLAYFWGKVKSYIANLLNSKADDSTVVHITGTETITGTKTLSSVNTITYSDTAAENTKNILYGRIAGTDYFRILVGGANNAGYLELATADDGNEPIYIRQYKGLFATLQRTATLLDGSGNTNFPGIVTASSFSGSLTGNATTATEFASNQSITLTGDVTGTASSKAGWSIATTLANSGVTAGRYTNVNVDAKGRVTAGNVKHSYTVAVNAAKNWYRIANANTSQTDTAKPIHAQFILTSYNASYDTSYYERWFVNAEVFGRTAHIVILGNNGVPFSQARILYENTIADLDANDRPAIDIYLNYVLPNGTTKIEIEEVYNQGWTFVADGQISASTVPTGFESVACDGVRNNGVFRSTYCDWASYASLQRSNFSANFTLADNNTYRARVLNCTGTITVTVPSLNSVNAWFIIKNFNTTSGVITIHPSTTSVLIDGSNANITLQPGEYIMLHSKAANAYTIVFDGRWKSQKANASHNQASNTITAMTSYAKANASSAIATSDSLNTAIGKLEYKVDTLNTNSIPPLEVVSLTANTSLTVTDSYTYQKVICLNTGGITVTLPTCSNSNARFFIKNNTNSKCYLALASGVTLDGSSGTIDLDPYGYINVIYGGSNNKYIIIGGSI